MRKFFCLVVLTALLFACSSKPDPADVAAQAAKQYYGYLLEGKCDAFVDGHYYPDSIPGSYREQLIDNAKMFVGQQKEEHQGIKAVRVDNAQADTLNHVANVFLVLTYKDGTNEEVVVPMVEHHGLWYMK